MIGTTASSVRQSPLRFSADFRKLLTIAFFSTFGDWMSLMALSYLVFQNSGLPTLGLLTSVPVLAGVVVSPWLGAWVDRHHARRAVVITTVAMAVVAAALQWYNPTSYLVLLTVKQLLGSVMYAGQSRLVPAVVPDHELERGAGLLNGADRLAAALGLAVGPVLAAQLGSLVFLVDAATFLLAALLFRSLRADVPPAVAEPSKTERAVRAALPWLRANAAVLALYCAGSLLWGLRDIGTLPVVESRLRLDIADWSGVFAALAIVGEVFGAVLLARYNPDLRTWGVPVAAGLVVVLGATVALPALITWLPLVIGGKVLEGLASNLLGTAATILLVFRAPEALRGRVAGVVFSLTMAVLAASKTASGYLIEHHGVVVIYRDVLYLVLVGVAVTGVAVTIRHLTGDSAARTRRRLSLMGAPDHPAPQAADLTPAETERRGIRERPHQRPHQRPHRG
ncbi:MAG TPA: MFS transporter [Micromonosporaceae bacterium]|nr:MFS transporter [Micromonosporaceae bacterium]